MPQQYYRQKIVKKDGRFFFIVIRFKQIRMSVRFWRQRALKGWSINTPIGSERQQRQCGKKEKEKKHYNNMTFDFWACPQRRFKNALQQRHNVTSQEHTTGVKWSAPTLFNYAFCCQAHLVRVQLNRVLTFGLLLGFLFQAPRILW